jgi:putative endonuclease
MSDAPAPEWFVYLLRCGPRGHLYVGRTTDVGRRFEEHRSGRGARYTRAFPPTEIAWSEGGHTAGSSARREAEIKTWSRVRKLALIG